VSLALIVKSARLSAAETDIGNPSQPAVYDPRPRATVEVDLHDEDAFFAALRAAAKDAKLRVRVEILRGRSPAPTDASYRVTVTETPAGIDVSVVDEPRDRLYVRHIEAQAHGLDEVTREAAAHLIV
jgi:hypothetical protein